MPSDILGARLDRWGDAEEESFRWVESCLAEFKHKPGWHFDVSRKPSVMGGVTLRPSSGIAVRVSFTAVDSRRPQPDWARPCPSCEQQVWDRKIPVSGEFYLPYSYVRSHDERLLWKWLREIIREMDQHESDEWFRVRGELMFDPHKGE